METSIKTVACIMPCFNYGHYLEEAIQSIYKQSRLPDEIIIVDDCSTDSTAEIASKHPLIKYIKHDKNKGLAAARNTGIKASTSEYCFSFDADDILRPKAVEEHLKLAREDTIVTCGLMAFGSESYTARPRVATKEILLKTNCIYSNSLFSKKMWVDVGGFDESDVMRHGWEDRLFWLEALNKGYKSVVSDYIALLWRRHGKNMSEQTANPHAEILQEYIYKKGTNPTK